MIIGVLVLVGVIMAPQYFNLGGGENNSFYKPGEYLSNTLKRRPPPLLEAGDTYRISGNEAGPKISEATMAPLGGAKPGVDQSWKIKVQYTVPIKSVDIVILMDNGHYPFALTLTEGTELDGVWTGLWNVKDTHDNIYQAEIKATGADGKIGKVVLSFM